jgi:hypothetical protein
VWVEVHDEDATEDKGWTRAQAKTRAKAAQALLERGRARLEVLSAKCLDALAALFDSSFHPEDSSVEELRSHGQSELAITYFTMYVEGEPHLLCVCGGACAVVRWCVRGCACEVVRLGKLICLLWWYRSGKRTC